MNIAVCCLRQVIHNDVLLYSVSKLILQCMLFGTGDKMNVYICNKINYTVKAYTHISHILEVNVLDLV